MNKNRLSKKIGDIGVITLLIIFGLFVGYVIGNLGIYRIYIIKEYL